jgi:hypothetical protein
VTECERIKGFIDNVWTLDDILYCSCIYKPSQKSLLSRTLRLSSLKILDNLQYACS